MRFPISIITELLDKEKMWLLYSQGAIQKLNGNAVSISQNSPAQSDGAQPQTWWIHHQNALLILHSYRMTDDKILTLPLNKKNICWNALYFQNDNRFYFLLKLYENFFFVSNGLNRFSFWYHIWFTNKQSTIHYAAFAYKLLACSQVNKSCLICVDSIIMIHKRWVKSANIHIFLHAFLIVYATWVADNG